VLPIVPTIFSWHYYFPFFVDHMSMPMMLETNIFFWNIALTCVKPDHISMLLPFCIFFQHMSMATMLETNIFSQLRHMRICSHDCQPFMIFLNSDSDFRGGIAICYWATAFDIWSDTNYCIYVLLFVFLMNWGNLAYAMMTYFSLPTVKSSFLHWEKMLLFKIYAFV
jgi:hypothetical protein